MAEQVLSPEEIDKALADLEKRAESDEPETLTVERAPGKVPAGDSSTLPAGTLISAQPPVAEEAIEQEEEEKPEAPAPEQAPEKPAVAEVDTKVETPTVAAVAAVSPEPPVAEVTTPAPPSPPPSSQATQLVIKGAEASAARIRANWDMLTAQESAKNHRLAELAKKHDEEGLSFAESQEANRIQTEIQTVENQKNSVAEQWLFTQAVIEDPEVATKKEGFLKALRLGMLARVMPDPTDSEDEASEKAKFRRATIDNMHRIVTGQTSPTAPAKAAAVPTAAPARQVRSVGPMHAGGSRAPAPKPKTRPAMSAEEEAEWTELGYTSLVSSLKGLEVNG